MTVEAQVDMSEGRRWLCFILVFLCGATMSMVLMAVPPAMPLLMDLYGTGAGVASWFMAIGSLASMIIALFAGMIQSKINPKGLLLLGTAFSAASAAVCLLAGESIALMLVGRCVFGVGMGCVNAAGPTLVMALWDDPAKRSAPMSVWACYVAFGSLVMPNSFTSIEPFLGGWAASFVLSGICAFVALALCAAFARIPREKLVAVSGGEDASASGAFGAVRKPNVLLLFGLFFVFTFIWSTWSSMAPTYMQTGAGMDPGLANSVTSISTITGVFGSLFAGFVMGRVRNQPLLALVFMVLAGVSGVLEFVFADPALATFESAFIGVAANAVMPAFMLCVQWAVDDVSETGSAMAFCSSLGVGVGGVVSVPVVGALYDATGSWAFATIPTAVIGAVGIVLAALFLVRCGKKSVAALS